MAALDFFIDIDRKERVAGQQSSSILAVPSFSQGDTITFRVRALQPTANFPAGYPPYSFIPNTGRTLQLAVGTKVGSTSSHAVEQYTWSLSTDAGDPYFYADVAFNTAAISTLLGSNASATAFLEIKLVEGGLPKTIFSKQVTIEASVIKNDTLTVTPGQTPLSAEVANASYLRPTVTQIIILQCPTDPTKKLAFYCGTDGAAHFDPIA